MAATTDKLADKIMFDVYAAMTIVTFVIMLGATLLLNDELDKTWGFWDEEKPKKAQTLTDPFASTGSTVFKLDPSHVAEWQLIHPGAEFPYKNFEWPTGFNPDEHQVKANTDNYAKFKTTSVKSEETGKETPVLELFMKGYEGTKPPEPEKVPEAPMPEKK